MTDAIVVHFGEVALKGGNRGNFERRLVETIHDALGPLGARRGRRKHARILVDLPPGTDVEAALERLAPVPGIAWFAPVVRVPRDLEAAEAAIRELARTDPCRGTFRVETKRSDKSYELDSMELNRRLGAAVGDETGRPVDLAGPETTFGVHVTPDGFLITRDRHEGVGGLPSGTAGRLLAFVSGGIDSPVATWKMMRRGVQCFLVHFLNRVVGDASAMDKIEEIGAVLARTQGRLTGLIVPFGDLQREIVATVPEDWRMIVYRRAMFRIGEVLLPRYHAKGFVTGDSVAQVASQTLDNMAVIHEAASHPVYAPLAGDDKTEITAAARRIGTFEISARPHTDCCSYLVGSHPVTHARLHAVREVEAGCDLDTLALEAADAVETRTWTR